MDEHKGSVALPFQSEPLRQSLTRAGAMHKMVFSMVTFIRETRGNDTDVELYRGFVLARCNTRLCARLAEGYWQRCIAEFLQDYFYDLGLRAEISESRHITGAFCCVLLDQRAKGLKR